MGRPYHGHLQITQSLMRGQESSGFLRRLLPPDGANGDYLYSRFRGAVDKFDFHTSGEHSARTCPSERGIRVFRSVSRGLKYVSLPIYPHMWPILFAEVSAQSRAHRLHDDLLQRVEVHYMSVPILLQKWPFSLFQLWASRGSIRTQQRTAVM